MSHKPLEVCTKCGWYTHEYSPGQCDPKRGAAADRLRDAVPETPATKLGYGFGYLVFEPDEDFHIRFNVERRRNEVFGLEEVWLLGDVSHDDAVDLVQTLVRWRARCKVRGAK